jgi:uncharacterized membrane protein YqiK
MRDYTITMTFSVQSENSDYEKISDFATELSENIMSDYTTDDIEIVEVNIDEIEDNNDYLDDDYLDEEEENDDY